MQQKAAAFSCLLLCMVVVDTQPSQNRTGTHGAFLSVHPRIEERINSREKEGQRQGRREMSPDSQSAQLLPARFCPRRQVKGEMSF